MSGETEQEFMEKVEFSINRSNRVLKERNAVRGPIYKDVGYKGAFLEMRTCMARLRKALWEKERPDDLMERVQWNREVLDSLRDLRNFTILAEICVIEDNSDGREYCDD